jgi:hypothetical protein
MTISDLTEKTEAPPPLTQREMSQFVTLSTLPTLERALDRLRWLEAENADLKERIDLAYEDVALDQRTKATLRAELAIAKTDLLLTQARVERFRAHVAALKAQRDPLDAMWAALAEYQPQANANGHGKSWWRMCSERTEATAREAAVDVAAAKAARDAAAWAADAAIQLGNAGQEWAESAIAAIRRAKEGQR